jgi:hypothetical protein
LAGDTRYYLTPPKDINMRIPDRILNCVGFIAHDHPAVEFLGTCFIVGMKGTANNHTYHIVTAKHIADVIDPGSFVIGMNSKQGERLLLKSGDEAHWYYHPTEPDSVDVAVLLVSHDLNNLDIEWIPDGTFATPERITQYGIGIGDEINVIGLFTEFSGTTKHIPIVRSGTVAMMPTDKIPTKDYGDIEAHLVEGRSIGGLSGSPVFVRNTIEVTLPRNAEPNMCAAVGQFHFFGLMRGHWDIPVNLTQQQAEAVNMGISIVIPAKKILETLNNPRLVDMRRQVDEQLKKKHYPTADIAKTKFTQSDFEAALKKASRKTGPEKERSK